MELNRRAFSTLVLASAANLAGGTPELMRRPKLFLDCNSAGKATVIDLFDDARPASGGRFPVLTR